STENGRTAGPSEDRRSLPRSEPRTKDPERIRPGPSASVIDAFDRSPAHRFGRRRAGLFVDEVVDGKVEWLWIARAAAGQTDARDDVRAGVHTEEAASERSVDRADGRDVVDQSSFRVVRAEAERSEERRG